MKEGIRMSAIKERLIGAVTIMDDETANKLWNMIISNFTNIWDDIPEEEPDEWDIQMLSGIDNDPDCKSFSPESSISWNN